MREILGNTKSSALSAITLRYRIARAYMPSKQSGFTLMELMIAVAIVSILALVSVPLYTQYIERSKNSAALAALSGLTVRMEKNYLDFRKYTDDSGCAIDAPISDDYSYSCASDGQTYTWTATSDDGDFKYSINEKFEKATLTFAGDSISSSNCWMILGGECY